MISRRLSTESAVSFEDSPRVHKFGRAGSALSRSSSSMAASPGALFRERTSSGGRPPPPPPPSY